MERRPIRNALPGRLAATMLAVLAPVTIAAAQAPAPETTPLAAFVAARGDRGEEWESQLQAVVLSFSEHYAISVARLRLDVPDQDLPAKLRADVYEALFSQAYGALRIASHPNARAALVNLVGLADVEHHLVAQLAGKVLDPEFAAEAIEVHRALRDRAWHVAGRYLDEPQSAQLRRALERWKSSKRHVDLDDFAEAVDVAAASAFGAVGGDGGGLFGISAAARAVDHARNLGERALRTVQYMPVMAGWLAEQTYFRVLASPELQEARDNLATLTPAIVNLSAATQSLPDVMERERKALTTVLEREQSALSALLGETRATIAQAAPLVSTARETVTQLDTTLATTADVVTRLDSFVQRPELERIDVAATRALVSELNTLVQGLNQAVAGAERLAGLQEAGLLARIQRVGVTLILVLCAAAFVTAVAYRLVSARLPRAAG